MIQKYISILTGVCLLVIILAACSKVPVTGRHQLDLVPDDQIMAMSADQYQKFMSEHEVITGTKEARMVKRVGERISAAVESYLVVQNKGGKPPEFLSTHPAHETRIEQIKDNLPEAMKYYRRK